MLPSPFCTPCHFHWLRELFFAGRGEHFARCTHMLQEGVGAQWAFGKGQVPSPACGALPPRPPDRGK